MTPSEFVRAAAMSRAVRRLVIALVALVIADRFEPPLLRSLEESRYEDPAKDFRFENSDLFGLGPLIEYFRDHPRGRVRRVLFLGNSVTFGYGLPAAEALPAQYQRLDRSAKAFNIGVNGSTMGSSFLVAKAAIDVIDLVYVLHRGDAGADPILPNLIPIEEADLARFHLAAPDRTEQLLAQAVNHWRLYRDAYRLQAALFGTSTREYIYLNKGVLARALVARLRAAQSSSVAADETATTESPMSDALPDGRREAQLRAESPVLWRFGDLFAGRRRPVVLLHIPDYSERLTDDAIGDFNRVFAPYARLVVIHIPAPLTLDGLHWSSAAAAKVARALWSERPEEHPR